MENIIIRNIEEKDIPSVVDIQIVINLHKIYHI